MNYKLISEIDGSKCKFTVWGPLGRVVAAGEADKWSGVRDYAHWAAGYRNEP